MLGFRELKHEVWREPQRVAADRQIQISCGYFVENCEVAREHDPLAADDYDLSGNRILSHRLRYASTRHLPSIEGRCVFTQVYFPAKVQTNLVYSSNAGSSRIRVKVRLAPASMSFAAGVRST